MLDTINLTGVSTHNLKNINIKIPLNGITAIYGRSGAGKSSLAFSTLYKLCHDEFEALENGFSENSEYVLSSYSGLIPAVAISQKNTNNNPRSTLYSYLNIPQILSVSKCQSSNLIPDFHFLKINKVDNECNCCFGLGEKYELVSDSIVNPEKCLNEQPFYFWNTGDFSDYYHQLLMIYCEKENINTSIPFKHLSDTNKDKILNSTSDSKIQFKYKFKGKLRTKKDFYKGPILYAKENSHLKAVEGFFKKTVCPLCNGARIKTDPEIKIYNISFKDFLLLSLDKLVSKLEKYDKNLPLLKTLSSICEMGMGYLHLARSIPSLSGGELQKLKFSKLLGSNISGVLIVIDEISSQLSSIDFPKIWEKMRIISERNTLVLVEHSQFFINKADHKFHIGYQAGRDGGEICPEEVISSFYKIKEKNIPKGFLEYTNISKNNIKNQNLSIPKKCLTVFTGVSGSGKSSLAKAISEYDKAIYISQKISNYSSRSILASSIQINGLIAEYFSKETGIDAEIFSPTKKGGCLTCKGIGVIKYERGYESDLYLTCPTCEGDLFDKNNSNCLIRINGKNILDIYSMEIKELLNYFREGTIFNILNTMHSLELSHLQLKRKTQTLSGGESRRLKLCEHLSKQRVSKKVLIIDEPAAGLDPETSSKLLNFIYSKVQAFEAVIIIEHRPEVIKYADYQVTLGLGSGHNGGNIISQTLV